MFDKHVFFPVLKKIAISYKVKKQGTSLPFQARFLILHAFFALLFVINIIFFKDI